MPEIFVINRLPSIDQATQKLEIRTNLVFQREHSFA